jgi:hypothetical protein
MNNLKWIVIYNPSHEPNVYEIATKDKDSVGFVADLEEAKFIVEEHNEVIENLLVQIEELRQAAKISEAGGGNNE